MMRTEIRAGWGRHGLVALLVATASSCAPTSPINQYAAGLQGSLATLRDKAADAMHVYRDGERARAEAASVSFRFTHSSTHNFMEKWKQTEARAASVRAAYNDSLQNADMFFTYCEKKADTIADSKLKQKVADKIRGKKESFTAAAKRCDGAIRALESSVQRGKDLITSLEVVGALNKLSDTKEEMDKMFAEANTTMDAVGVLIEEGRGVLDKEFAGLR